MHEVLTLTYYHPVIDRLPILRLLYSFDVHFWYLNFLCLQFIVFGRIIQWFLYLLWIYSTLVREVRVKWVKLCKLYPTEICIQIHDNSETYNALGRTVHGLCATGHFGTVVTFVTGQCVNLVETNWNQNDIKCNQCRNNSG